MLRGPLGYFGVLWIYTERATSGVVFPRAICVMFVLWSYISHFPYEHSLFQCLACIYQVRQISMSGLHLPGKTCSPPVHPVVNSPPVLSPPSTTTIVPTLREWGEGPVKTPQEALARWQASAKPKGECFWSCDPIRLSYLKYLYID